MKRNYRFLGAKIGVFLRSLFFLGLAGYFLLVLLLNIILNWTGDIASRQQFVFFGYHLVFRVPFIVDLLAGLAWLAIAIWVWRSYRAKRMLVTSRMQNAAGITVVALGTIMVFVYGRMIYGLVGSLMLAILFVAVWAVYFILFETKLRLIWRMIGIVWQVIRQTFLNLG